MRHVNKPARAPIKIATFASPKVDKRRLSVAEQNAGCKPLSSFSCLYTLFLKTVSLLSVYSEEDTGIGKGGCAVLLREGAWSLVFYDQFPTSSHSRRTDIFFYSRKKSQVGKRYDTANTHPPHDHSPQNSVAQSSRLQDFRETLHNPTFKAPLYYRRPTLQDQKDILYVQTANARLTQILKERNKDVVAISPGLL